MERDVAGYRCLSWLGPLEVVGLPAKKSPGPSVKKPDTYEALRDKGMSKARAARISNAQANKTGRKKASKKS